MKILITGATGFVGSHLCELLSKSGHELYLLVRNKKKLQELKLIGNVITGDLSYNQKNSWIKNLPSDLDAVIHIAGIVHSYKVQDFYNINTEGTKQLFSDLKEHYKKLKFIYFSSLAAFGPTTRNALPNEVETENPISHYGRSKLIAEQYLKDSRPEDWELFILRPPMIIGPRDPAMLDLFKMVKDGIVLIPGLNGEQKKYSFISVFDLISLIEKILTSDCHNNNQTFFTAHPQVLKFEEIISIASLSLGKKSIIKIKVPHFILKILSYITYFLSKVISMQIRLTPDKFQEIHPMKWTCSGEKLSNHLNYNFTWGPEKIIEETLQDYKNRNWL